MPTPLPTLAPDLAAAAPRADAARRPQPRRAEAPESTFSRTLSEKRRPERDDHAAETPPAAGSRPTGRAGVADTADRPREGTPEGEGTKTRPAPDAAQQPTGDAQGLPADPAGPATGTRTTEHAGPEFLVRPAGVAAAAPTGPTAPAGAETPPPTTDQVAATPGEAESDGSARARATASPATPRSGSVEPVVPPPAAPTPPRESGEPAVEPQRAPATQPPPPAPRSGESSDRGDGRPSDGRFTPPGDGGPPRDPAVSRAAQVQSAVRLENATGQPALGTMPGAPVPAVAGEARELELPTPGGTSNAPAPESHQPMGRVLRGLTAMINQRGGVMTMRLDPPDLGQLRIQMTIARGVVTAQFQPATAEAQALLDRSLGALRSALESQGLSVERLSVQAAPPTTSSPARGEHGGDGQAAQQQRQEQHDAGQGESRGRRDGEPHDSSRRSGTPGGGAFELQDLLRAES